MATYTWGGTGTGFWGTASNWTPTGTPSSTSDTADFTGSAGYTAKIASGLSYTVGTVVLNDPLAVFDLVGTLSVGTSSASGTFTLSAGTLIIDSSGTTPGRLRFATVADTGGTVTFNDGTLIGVTWQGTLDLSAALAVVKVDSSASPVSANASSVGLTLEGSGGVGNGTALVTGVGSELGLLDYQTFNNATIDLGSNGDGAALYVGEGSLNSTGAAKVTLGSGVQIVSAGSNVNASIFSDGSKDELINEGVITAGAVSGQFDLSAVLTNEGTIQVENGDTLTVDSFTLTNASTGTLSVDATSSLQIESEVVDQGGTITVAAGGNFSITSTGTLQGYGTLNGAVFSAGAITAAGGTLEITGAVNGGTGADITVASNSTARIDGSVIQSGLTFAAGGTNEVIALGNLGGTSATVHGFYTGDTIWLTNVDDSSNHVSVSYSSSTGILTVSDQGAEIGTLTLAPAYVNPSSMPDFTVGADSNGGTDITTDAVACYVSGTLILTDQGEVPVEALTLGRRVRTRSGRLRPIKWIGHRRVDLERHPDPARVQPVRIAAGAFGAGMPKRDLYLSPDHAVFAEGVLIPVKHLVNDATITPAPRASATYYHIELEDHDVIFAEGLPCESYLDNGTRGAFANGAVLQLHPDFGPAERCEAIGETAGCAPLRIEGAEVARVDARLRRRAKRLGHRAIAPARPAAAPVATEVDVAALLQPDWYRTRHPDVASAGIDPALHFRTHGRAEGRLPCPEADLVRGLGLLDPATIIRTMPDVVAAGIDRAEHFCGTGWRERRRPNPYFDTGWYLDTHDVPDGMNPLVHYVLFGERQGLAPSRHFDPTWYRQHYGLSPSLSALAHYLAHRRTRRFSPRPGFDVQTYVQAHEANMRPDRDPYAHYLAIGRFGAWNPLPAAA